MLPFITNFAFFFSSGMFKRIQSMSPRVMPASGERRAILKCCSQPLGGGDLESLEDPVVESGVERPVRWILVGRNPGVRDGLPNREDGQRAHAGLGFLVPAPRRRGRPDAGSYNLASAVPEAHAFFSSEPIVRNSRMRHVYLLLRVSVVFPMPKRSSLPPAIRGTFWPVAGVVFKDHLDRSPDRYSDRPESRGDGTA